MSFFFVLAPAPYLISGLLYSKSFLIRCSGKRQDSLDGISDHHNASTHTGKHRKQEGNSKQLFRFSSFPRAFGLQTSQKVD